MTSLAASAKDKGVKTFHVSGMDSFFRYLFLWFLLGIKEKQTNPLFLGCFCPFHFYYLSTNKLKGCISFGIKRITMMETKHLPLSLL